MNKRALLLTAATVALLSGQAMADTTITSKTTAALKTSAAGNITITDGTGSEVGSVQIPSSSTASATPAIEFDSSATVTIAEAGNIVSYKATSDAVGIKMDAAGYTGEFINAGSVDLTGSGTDKIGINISGTGTLSGATTDPNITNTYLDGIATVVDLATGSTVKVEGDGSYGIQVASTATVNGQIYIAGTVQATSSSTTAVYGVDMAGMMTGNFVIDSGGFIQAIGTGAQGVIISGQLTGSFINSGEIETVGTSKLKSGASNPEGGAGLTIENSISGGVYNAGSFGSTTTGTGSIIVEGNAPAVSISANTTQGPITIGAVSDPDLLGTEGPMSFINRGIIESVPQSPDTSVAAVVISGTDSGDNVTLSDGFSNTGTIEALGSSTTAPSASHSPVQITALNIGSDVTITPGGALGTAFYNGDETPSSAGGFTPAEIIAEYSGNISGAAVAIDIGTSTTDLTSVPSLDNAGTITASATTADKSVTSLSAFAIIDNSGTLLNILNESTGVISAGVSALDNSEEISRAIDLENAKGSIQITNNGRITGDVLLGSHSDTVIVSGTSSSAPATLTGSVYFGGNDGTNPDVLTVGSHGTFTGAILNNSGNYIDIDVENAGTLNILNNGTMSFTYASGGVTIPIGGKLPAGIAPGVNVTTLTVDNGATLGLTIAQPFNENDMNNDGAMVSSQGQITISSGATFRISYGSFISSSPGNPAKFVLLQAPNAADLNVNLGALQTSFNSQSSFLYSGTLDLEASGSATGDNQLVLTLTQKCAAEITLSATCTASNSIGLTGYAKKMYDIANAALVNDDVLGSAIITAGAGVTDAAQGQAIYQKIYSQFAPDVTGSTRAIAISLTDSSSGPVAARQRALRMYANQDGDLTLWGQEFAQNLSVSSSTEAAGYRNTGFGFVVGADGGDPADGRYGGAFTFYSGNTTEKEPRLSRTNSEWYLFSGYGDWRGKRMFFDSQVSVGYASLTGKRKINIYSDDDTPSLLATRTAANSHAAEFLAGSVSTGFILHSGGTSLTPQIDVDGMTMRQEGYSESNGDITTRAGDGFDLAVQSNYASSLRGFAGLDLRQDLRFDGFYFQPEARAGYRYDFLDGVDKITANFVSEPLDKFTVEGPDPSRGNLVLGGGFAVTTGAWSLGLNYDYKRGIGGTGGTDQVGSLTLLGRI